MSMECDTRFNSMSSSDDNNSITDTQVPCDLQHLPSIALDSISNVTKMAKDLTNILNIELPESTFKNLNRDNDVSGESTAFQSLPQVPNCQTQSHGVTTSNPANLTVGVINNIVNSKVHFGKKVTQDHRTYNYGVKQKYVGRKKTETAMRKSEILEAAKYDQRQVTDAQLQLVAKKLTSKWQSLGQTLSLSLAKLSFIYEDYYQSPVETDVPYNMLLQWSHKVTPDDTVAALFAGLDTIGLCNVAIDMARC